MLTDHQVGDLQSQIGELETQRKAGLISDITFTVRRNLLVSQAGAAAQWAAPPTVPAPPPGGGMQARLRELEAGDLEVKLHELEARHAEGQITDIAFTVQRNLLLNQADKAARRRPAAARPIAVAAPPPLAAFREPRRNRWGQVGAALIAASVVVGGLYLVDHRASLIHGSTAAGPTATSSVTTPPTATGSQPAPPSAAPHSVAPSSAPSMPAASSLSVGQSAVTRNGQTLTVLTYVDHFKSTAVLDNPPAGGFYAALRVRVCNDTSSGAAVTPLEFVLVEPDDTLVDFTSGPFGGRQPSLPFSDIPAHKCVTGWINYGVTSKPTRARFVTDQLEWTLP